MKQTRRIVSVLLAVLLILCTMLPTAAQELENFPEESALESVMAVEDQDNNDSVQPVEEQNTEEQDSEKQDTEIEAVDSEETVSELALPLSDQPLPIAFSASEIITSNNLTRAEWLHNLAVMFEWSVESENYPDAYYSDVSAETAYYEDILAAIEFGAVNIAAGEELRPNDPATRDFVAQSLNAALQIQPAGTTSFSDSTSISDLTAAQAAVEQGWFTLSGGKFLPEQPITTAEIEKISAGVQTILGETIVEDNYNNQYVYGAGVKVFSDEAAVSIDEDGTIRVTGAKQTVNAGDTVVAFSYGIPNVYVATSASANGSDLVIATREATEAEIEAAFSSIESAGSSEIDLSDFEGAEGIDTLYVTSDSQVRTILQTYGLEVKKNSVVATKKFTLANGLEVEFAANLYDLKLEHKVSLGKNYYVAIDGKYSLSSTVSLDAIKAANGSSSITLGTVPIAGVGRATISLELQLDGQLAYTYTGTFKAGIRLSSGSVSLVKDFRKTGFSSDIEANASIGIKTEFSVDIFFAKGNIYTTNGLKANYVSHQDSTSTLSCSTLTGWWFTQIGASAKIGIGKLSKSYSKTVNVFDVTNSPVKLSFHWENGQRVDHCTRGETAGGEAAVKYLTPADSKYGSSSYNGSKSTGTGSNGKPYTIYTYSLDRMNYATITGYKGNVSAISVPGTLDGYKVTAIGNNAFKNNVSLRSVILPRSVTSIGTGAFQGCTNLASVTIPDSVLSMGNNVFETCTSLTRITMPDSITEIGNRVFAECTALRDVKLSGELKTIGYGVFYNCTALTGITIPKTLQSATSFSPGTFEGCSNLTGITLEEGIEKVPNYLFHSCKTIQTIKIPTSVKTVGAGAFKNSSVTRMDIPNSVAEIENYAFENCSELTSVTIPNSVTKIGTEVFSGCTSLTSVTLPDSVVEIGNRVFAECTALKNVKLSGNLKTMGYGVFYNCAALTSITIPKTMQSAGFASPGTFEGCSNLKTVILEEGIEQVPSYLFQYCTSLETVKIPTSVKTIGTEAFQNSRITTIDIPDSVTSIANNAFQNCPELTTVTMGDSVTDMGNHVFSECTSLKNIKLSNSLKTIGYGTFYNCTSLTDITIPKTLQSASFASAGTFEGCKKLTSVTLEEGIEKVPDYLFKYCTTLTTVRIPSSVTVIGTGAFEHSKISSIEIPNTVTSIGSSAFYDCPELTTVTIPDSVTSIGSNAFESCTELTTVTMGDSVTDMGNHVFSECTSLKKIKLSNSLKTIGYATFYNCISLTEVTIPKTLQSASFASFGTFEGCKNLTGVTLEEGIEKVPDYLFKNCTTLETVKIPTSVTAIGTGAFRNSQITSIELPDSVTAIGNYAFDGCEKLEKATIPYTVTSISSNAFNGCSLLTIYGYTGSAAETFADKQNINFVSIGVAPTPTPTPTAKPTATPTAKPTATPTANPTATPTAKPTATPTAKPTATPTAKPTATPTAKPTATPTAKPTAKPTATPTPNPTTNFEDVKESAWYYTPVQWAVANGVTSGTSATTFIPGNQCTRAQAVTFLWNAKGQPEPKSTKNPFTDVKSNAWYYKAVLWAVENNITAGTSATTFSPNATCTRAQIVTFLHNYAGKPAASGKNPFTDVKSTQWYYQPILWAVSEGVTAGTSPTAFSPTNTCTRGQIVTFLYNYMGK